MRGLIAAFKHLLQSRVDFSFFDFVDDVLLELDQVEHEAAILPDLLHHDPLSPDVAREAVATTDDIREHENCG